MDSSEDEVSVPEIIKDLYALAKESSVYYEELTRTWNESALARFRDALDHIISAGNADDVDEVKMHVSAAKEHLSDVIAEPIQEVTSIGV